MKGITRYHFIMSICLSVCLCVSSAIINCNFTGQPAGMRWTDVADTQHRIDTSEVINREDK